MEYGYISSKVNFSLSSSLSGASSVGQQVAEREESLAASYSMLQPFSQRKTTFQLVNPSSSCGQNFYSHLHSYFFKL